MVRIRSIGYISSTFSQLCDITSTKADGSVNNLILVDITIITMKKAKAECDLPEELRCRRSDSKSWRCSKHRAEDSSYCEHHRDNLRANYKKKKTRKNGYARFIPTFFRILPNSNFLYLNCH
jgi:hypothetical protein